MVPSLQPLPDRHLCKIVSSCDIQNDPGFRLMCKQGRLCLDMSGKCTVLCCLQFCNRCCMVRYNRQSYMDLEVWLKDDKCLRTKYLRHFKETKHSVLLRCVHDDAMFVCFLGGRLFRWNRVWMLRI